DYRPDGIDFHMRPQFYHNQGRYRFLELKPDQAGVYFGKKFLGRGLAKLDWNRDGLMDFAVSNIGDPVSLVTNQTVNAGHFLNVKVHGVSCPRDAIGTVV